MSYLKAHIFVPFHCFVQVFLPRKYSAVSSLALDYITLPYIVNELSLCSQVLAAISWYDTTKPFFFFVNENDIKVNKENYRKHLKRFLQLKNLLSVMAGYLFKILLHYIDRIWYKISLKKLSNAVSLNV